ncbi:hypothetical protein VMT65_22645 [Nocardia sp. CDC153]|uniref:hypothetical protein n=1 Tax=Nocardia sp. CDC153 TaxID=3112167 RepID=UPI002DBD8468|nr:hypothetical protein [Nocardia sp. CDC153]MEC3955850.1 hypothetical protein [Nocardia sp. CDC153]
MGTSTLSVVIDRIWQRRWLVAAVALVVAFGAYYTAHGRMTTYTARVLVSAGSNRPPTQDAILAQGFTYYLNDPSYQASLGHKKGFPDGINSFSAQFVAASPLFYVQVTANSAAAAVAAAPKVAQLYVDDVNGRLDANRAATADAMTASMMKVWSDRLAANDPNAYSAQIQLQQAIDVLNADTQNRLTVLQSGAGATPIGPGKTKTMGTGIIGGLILGCVVALMAGAGTRRLYTDYDVAEKTGVKPLDVIPAGGSPRRDARRDVALRHVANLVSRECTRTPTSIAVAPVSRGPGGTHIARAIAEHRAAQGTKTIFLDTDLRDPGDGQAGVVDYLEGRIRDLRELTHHGAAGFAEIKSGAAGGDPYPLFDRRRVRELLHTAGAAADLVVVRVPPLSLAAEAQIVADVADLTILVIECGRTRVREVTEAVRAVNQVGAEVLGAVLIDSAAGRGPLRRWIRR